MKRRRVEDAGKAGSGALDLGSKAGHGFSHKQNVKARMVSKDIRNAAVPADVGTMSFDEMLASNFGGEASVVKTPRSNGEVETTDKSHQPKTKSISGRNSKAAKVIGHGKSVGQTRAPAASKQRQANVKPDIDADDVDGEQDDGEENEEAPAPIKFMKSKSAPVAAAIDADMSVSRHKGQLAALEKKDPAFYAYLQRNSKALLEFGEDDDDEDEDEVNDDEDEEEDGGDDDMQGAEEAEADEKQGEEEGDEPEEGEAIDGKKEPILVTPQLARRTFEAAFKKHSYRALQKVLSMFRAAVYLGDGPDVIGRLGLRQKTGPGGKTGKDARGEDRTAAAERDPRPPMLLKYRVSSSAVFMLVVTQVLQHAGPALAFHLGTAQSAGMGGKPKKNKAGASSVAAAAGPAPRVPLPSYSGWSKVELPSRALLKCSLHLLGQATDPSLQLFILRCLRTYVPYLQTQGILIRKFIAAVVLLWSETEDEGVRVEAFLRARGMATTLPHPSLDMVLKSMYHAYARAGKAVTDRSMPGLLLMSQCVAEVYGLDDSASYTHAFVYIRDLAVHLRAALTTKTPEAVAKVMSWQFLCCLRLWTGVIVAHGSDSSRPLFALAYPLIQIILGAVRLQPNARYTPFRLHAVALLNELAWATGMYIPIAPLLWEVLRSPLLSKKAKEAVGSGGGGGPTPLSLMVRAGTATCSSKAFQDAVVSRLLDLLLDGMKASFASPAFPEIAAPVIIQLRHFAKETRAAGWRARAKALVDALSGHAASVASKRAGLHAAPADKVSVAAFMSVENEKLRRERAAARLEAARVAMEEAKVAAAQAVTREGEEARLAKKRKRSGDVEDEEYSSSEEEGDVEGEDDEDEQDEDEESPTASRSAAKHALAAPVKAKSSFPPVVIKGKGKRGQFPADVVQDLDMSDLLGDE